MRVFDAFLFNDELDLLELRLEELEDVVDWFVLCELPVNFRGQPKPLHYHENRERFGKWAEKIAAFVPAAYPDMPHPAIEHFQRRELARGLQEAEDGDLIVISDVDEILDSRAVEYLKRNPPPCPLVMLQHLYYYSPYWLQRQSWPGPVAYVRDGELQDCQKLRSGRHFLPEIIAGWHFSYFGTADQIANKVRSLDIPREAAISSDVEVVAPNPDDLAFIEKCRISGADILGRTAHYAEKVRVPVIPGETHPLNMLAWLKRHPEYAA